MCANGQSQDAKLLGYPLPKCFLSDFTGKFADNVVSCIDLPYDEFLSQHRCNCTNMWDLRVKGGLTDGFKEGVTLYSFVPDDSFIVNTTDAVLVLQVYYNCEL